MHNMKKYPIIFFTAAAALAACSKTEVAPVQNDTRAEITYETAPVTKALGTNQYDFEKTKVFASFAYYHKEDWSWGTSTSDTPSLFVGTTGNKDEGALIAWTGSAWRHAKKDATTGAWVNDKTYYWPKAGKLSFFAWSLNKEDLGFPTGSDVDVTCVANMGIMLQQYNVKKDKNVDFLVAEPALNKTKNENTYVREGVPTLFKHKFTDMNFTVQVKDKEYAANGIVFTLNSIVFNNVKDQANYYQNIGGTTPAEVVETGSTKTTQTYTSTDQVVDKTTATAVTGVDQHIYIPQTFTDVNPDDDPDKAQTVTVTYTVTYDTDGDGTPEVTETVSVIKKIKELTGDWGIGKKYTINLTFALDEILWDPAVEDWTDVSSEEIFINK